MRSLMTFVLGAGLALTALGAGPTYWVTPDGQATWAACRSDAPLAGIAGCSIATANANAVAGDTIYLRGGTYLGNIFIAPANSGSAGSPITYSPYAEEQVVFDNQKVPNRSHETSPWASWNGAAVEHSTIAWDGILSTKFSAASPGQGIRSDAFPLVRSSGLGFYWTARIRSNQTSVHVQLRKVDGSEIAMDKDFALVPGFFNTIGDYRTIASSGDFYLVITAPAGAPSGTWYVDGTRMNSYYAAIHFAGKDYIVVHGMDVQSAWRGIELRNGADYNEISSSSFADANVFAANTIYDAGGLPSTYNWIHDSIFRDSGYAKRSLSASDCDDIVDLLRIGNTTATDNSSYNLVENNVFYHGGHALVVLASKYNTFRNNIMHNEGWLQNREGPCASSAGGYNDPLLFGNRNLNFENPGNNGGRTLIEGNRSGFAGTPPDDDGGNGIENPGDYNIVRYNFAFKNDASGYSFKTQAGISAIDTVPDHNRVYNNTLYANGAGTYINRGFQGGFFFTCTSTPKPPQDNVIKNNIVFGNAVAVNNPGCHGYSYTNNFESNPSFVNPDVSDPTSLTLPDLKLQSSSPAKDKAGHLTTVAASDSGSSTTLILDDARYFQDGSWAPPGRSLPDVISIGTTVASAVIVRIAAGSATQPSIDYERSTITLEISVPRRGGDKVWLYRKSDGGIVLTGAGPDFGASERGGTLQPPRNLRIIR